MATPEWDRTNLVPQTVSPPKLMTNNTSGGVGIGNGSEQIVANTPPRWGLKFTDIPLNTRARILAWNVMSGIAQGRLNPFLVPLFDRNRAPFSTMKGVDGANVPSTVRMVGAVAPGAVAMTIEALTLGSQPLAGMHFSVNERMYRLVTLGAGSADGSYTSYPVTVTPPVREAIPTLTALEIDDPWFRVRLASDDEMNDVDLEAKKFGKATVNLVEDA